MGSQLGVTVGSVGIGISCTCQDCCALNARLETLLSQSKPLEFIQAIFLSGAIYQSVFEQHLVKALMKYRGFGYSFPVLVVTGIFKLPAIRAFVMHQLRIIVPLIQVFEDRGENLGNLLGKIDPLC